MDAPLAHLVGIRQRARDPEVIELRLRSPQAGFNISEAFPIRELGERHAEVLIPAGEALNLLVAPVALGKNIIRNVEGSC